MGDSGFDQKALETNFVKNNLMYYLLIFIHVFYKGHH